MSIALWVVQGLLALVFLAAGGAKVSMPITSLQKNMAWVTHFSPVVVRLIGAAEILGALGLILPKLTHILPWLTIVAAIGLVIVMVGAVVYHVTHNEMNTVAPSIVLLVLAAFVVIGYIAWVPVA